MEILFGFCCFVFGWVGDFLGVLGDFFLGVVFPRLCVCVCVCLSELFFFFGGGGRLLKCTLPGHTFKLHFSIPKRKNLNQTEKNNKQTNKHDTANSYFFESVRV